jgi:hypothetical protein
VIARLAFLVVWLAPSAAAACATCVASAYGDRTFNWAFIGLILMPFGVGFGIAGVFAARYYAPSGRFFRAPLGRFRAPLGRFRAPLRRFRAPLGGVSRSAHEGTAQVAPHEETSL